MKFNFNIQKTNDVIVYIESLKSEGNNHYSEIIVDFRLQEDLYSFNRHKELELKQSPFIVYNYYSSKRLVKGCYYALDIKTLLRADKKNNDNSTCYLDCFDFSNIHEATTLFGKHDVLDKKDITLTTKNDKIDIIFNNPHLKVNINDTGQGNWNEIIESEHAKLIYDIGTNIKNNDVKLRQMIENRINEYEKSKPILVISHWDLDHYNLLKAMTDDELKKCFSGFIIKNITPSVSSQKIASRLIKLGIPVITVKDYIRTSKKAQIMHQYIDFGLCILYIGEKSRNINYSGIALTVRGMYGVIVLTGDISLAQASFITNDCYANMHEKKKLNIVVPHHGGDYPAKKYREFKVPSNSETNIAAISVDANNNNYGHPAQKIIKIFEDLHFSIKRTDKEGTLILEL